MKLISILVLTGIIFVGAQNSRANTGSQPSPVVSCTEIREEPGAPTYAFELTKTGSTYEARYLNLPGDETAPPTIVASFPGLECSFLKRNKLLLRCQKPGVTIEGVKIVESKLSLIANEPLSSKFQEFRAVGIEVPDVYLVYRFGSAASCVTRR